MQKGALFAGEGHILDAVLVEIVEAERSAKFVVGIGKAGFVVELVALGEFGEFQIPGCRTVGVKDLERVKFAITVDHRQRPIVIKLPVHGVVDVVDVAGQAQLVLIEVLQGTRRSAEEGIAEGIARTRCRGQRA